MYLLFWIKARSDPPMAVPGKELPDALSSCRPNRRPQSAANARNSSVKDVADGFKTTGLARQAP